MNLVNKIELPSFSSADKAVEKGNPIGQRMDLVEHVKVTLTVALGAAEMPVGKLFALAPGEVVPLDREVDEPIDIRLHGKTVARGHLVAVGDKFGVRVSEVAS